MTPATDIHRLTGEKREKGKRNQKAIKDGNEKRKGKSK